MLVIGGTAVLDSQGSRTNHLVLYHLDEARFANPRLPTQHHNVTPARLHLRPAVPQEAHLVLASHQRRETAGRCDVEALLHLSGEPDLIHLEWHDHAFERLRPECVADE